MSLISNEDLEALIGIGDMHGAEQGMLQQRLLAQQLRNSMQGIQGNAIMPNLGRAAYGAAGAVNDYKAGKAVPGIATMKQDLLTRLLKARQPTNAAIPAAVITKPSALPEVTRHPRDLAEASYE